MVPWKAEADFFHTQECHASMRINLISVDQSVLSALICWLFFQACFSIWSFIIITTQQKMREMWTLGSQISSWPHNVFISYCHVPCMLTLGGGKQRCSIIPRSSRGDWELIKKNKWLILWSVYPWNVEMLMSEHLSEMFLINAWFRGPVKISRKLILIKSNNMLIKLKSGLDAGLSYFTHQPPGADFSRPRGAGEDGKSVLPGSWNQPL